MYQFLGYIILRLRFPNKKERKRVFEETYNNCYTTIGAEPILKTISVIFFIFLLLFLIAVIYSVFKHGPST